MRIARDNYRTKAEVDKLTQLYNKATTERICNEQLQIFTEGMSAGLLTTTSVDAVKPIVLETQGQRAYGDHAYVFYQIPVKAKKLPIVFQHGGAQSKRT